jgi:hypothetical protein
MNPIKKPAFSLIEVAIAVALLVLVGVGILAVNTAVSRLVSDAEVISAAYALNEESVVVAGLQKKMRAASFESYLTTDKDCKSGEGCFVSCPIESLSTNCELTGTAAPVRLGRTRISYVRKVIISGDTASGYTVQATTSWGSGPLHRVEVFQKLN